MTVVADIRKDSRIRIYGDDSDRLSGKYNIAGAWFNSMDIGITWQYDGAAWRIIRDGGAIKVSNDSINSSAFGEVLFGELHAQFQGSFEYTVSNTDINVATITNGASVTQSTGMAVVGTSTTASSKALLQSKRHAKYRPGLGGVCRFTALFASPVASTNQFFGLADEPGSSAAFKNGYMVGYDGTTFGFHRFSGDTITTTALSSWDDPLDGTGKSGITIDQTKLAVFFIQYQYLGGGAIKVYYEDTNSGSVLLVHTDKYSGVYTQPSTLNPNYHFFICVNNKSTTANLTVKSSSYAYFVEGKTDLIELHQPQNSSELIELSSITTAVPIFTIRNKSAYASKTNFVDILLEHYSVAIEANSSNNLGSIHLIRNATLGGTPSFSDINTNNSVVEIDTSATSATGGKSLIHPILAGKNDRILENVKALKTIISPGESLSFIGESSNSATMRAHALWRELF